MPRGTRQASSRVPLPCPDVGQTGRVPSVIAHPFRLDASGRVAVVEQGSDDHHAQALAVLLSTRRGERPLAPLFGTSDPTFAEVDAAELAAQVALFGPPVTITDVSTTYSPDGTTADTVVSFT